MTAGRSPAALLAALMAVVTVTMLLPSHRRRIPRLVADLDGRRAGVPSVGGDGWLLGARGRSAGRRQLASRLVAPGVLGLVVGGLLGAQVLVSSVAACVVMAVVVVQRGRQRRRRAATARRGRVIEACTVMAADLRAGRTPQDALAGAATVCPELEVASAAARLGGDVGAALDSAARTPGGAGLRAIGAAWRVAERSGAAFGTITERLADSLRADEAIRRQVAAGLSGTRSTARLLAGLPLFGTVLGFAIGADPIAFLSGTPIGWLCLGVGLALMVLGLAWVERLAESCEGAR